jgi:hypothetical protein
LRYLQSAEPSSLSCSAYHYRQHATFEYTRWTINSSQHLAQPYSDIVSAFCQEIRLLLYNIVRPQPANDCWNAIHQKKINLHCFRTATVTSNHLLYLLPPSTRLNGIFPFQFGGGSPNRRSDCSSPAKSHLRTPTFSSLSLQYPRKLAEA